MAFWNSETLRKRLPDDVERQRFARQVRVRAEVVGQMLFDVPQLAVNCDQQLLQPPALCPLPPR